MRINEFADANEMVALFKLINDGVWAGLAKQQQLQASVRAAKARQPKLKPLAAQPKANAPARNLSPGPMLTNPVTQNNAPKLG